MTDAVQRFFPKMSWQLTNSLTLERSRLCARCVASAHQQKNVLNKHMLRHTKCSQCDYTASRKIQLNHHTLQRHTEVRPFECDICDFATSSKRTLDRHVFRHTGRKPFKCNMCDYAAAFVSELNQHKRRHGETRDHGKRPSNAVTYE